MADIYMKKIDKLNFIDIQEIQNKYKLKYKDLASYIGNNGKIYLIFKDYSTRPVLAENRIVCLTPDWGKSGGIEHTELLDFSSSFEDIHVIQPIGSKYLINSNKSFITFITDDRGRILRKIDLGLYSTNTCIVDGEDNIIVGYYDEVIFDDFYEVSSGLILYDEFGTILWKNEKYDIVNCYALDVDDGNNIWFYPDDKIIKVDSRNNYNMYDVGIRFSRGFLFNKLQNKFIFQNISQDENEFLIGQDKFVIKDFINERPCIFILDGRRHIEVKGFTFRNSKALLWDRSMLYWFEWNDA